MNETLINIIRVFILHLYLTILYIMKRNIVEGYVKVTSDAIKWLTNKTKRLWDLAVETEQISKLKTGYLVHYEIYEAIKQELEKENKKDPYGIKNINFSTFKARTASEEELKKWELQRYERGFDDTEIYDLDDTIIKFLLPRLKVFREIHGSAVPQGLTVEQWNKILDEMIYGFEYYLNSDDIETKEYDKALDLFKTYFESLWF